MLSYILSQFTSGVHKTLIINNVYLYNIVDHQLRTFLYCQAIRDGVIEATIDHEKGYVQSRETSDVYKTREPMAAFHQRITFCLDIHNNSVKVMCPL